MTLNQLIAQRGQVKGRLTRLQNAYETFLTDNDIGTLEITYEKSLSAWDNFDTISCEIELADPTNLDVHLTKRQEFEKCYAQLISKIRKIIEGSKIGERASVASTQSQIEVKLPVMHLPKFSGQYDQWLTFFDSFSSLIDKNSQLTDIQKFHYLKSSLIGEAANVISLLTVSENNYKIAVDLLVQRFENKRLIVKNHLDALFNLPQVTKDSAASLRSLLDTVNTHVNALQALSLPISSWDAILVYIITSKLNLQARQDWELIEISSELPTFDEIKRFLSKRCVMLESIGNHDKGKPSQVIQSSRKPPNYNNNFHITTGNMKCTICKGSHTIYQCHNFQKLTPDQRYREILNKKLCINCLAHHHISKCPSTYRCRTCQRKHNTLLHKPDDQVRPNSSTNSMEYGLNPPGTSSSSNIPVVTDDSFQHNSNAGVYHSTHAQLSNATLLSTAIVLLRDILGNFHRCRCLLDVGSQSNLISARMCNQLNLPTKKTSTQITGINNSSFSVTQSANVFVKSQYNSYSKSLPCLVIPHITGQLPEQNLGRQQIIVPNNIKLADPLFNRAGDIDLLIGAEIFWDLLSIGQIKINNNQPYWQKTKLGWIVGGSYGERVSPNTHCNLSLTTLEDTLQKFWALEEVGPKLQSTEENRCESHFQKTVTRDITGRFVVKLPFKRNTAELGDSRSQAEKRLFSLERKLSKSPELDQLYRKFIQEYMDLGHMKLATPTKPSLNCFYLPHHAVINTNSSTTKLRVVFDGSAKSSTGISLNDILMVGPTIQQDLFSILTRFRTHKFALTADIQKMYRQVAIDKADARYQKILWRNRNTEPIQEYELSTVTYGTSSAPFLAIRCLQQLGHDEKLNFPESAEIILRDFYVDDLVTGADTIERAIRLREEVTEILSRGKFTLTKFASNSRELISDDITTNSVTIFDKDNKSKTLGIVWSHNEDKLKYPVDCFQANTSKTTKRLILSRVAQIFDPLGLVGPIIISAKIMMQQLWSIQLGWDESVPPVIHTQWSQFVNNLSDINSLSIPRRIISVTNPITFEIHGFADASESAYGACVYLKSMNANQEISVHLIASKSRVAPLKKTTIPRLELCAALLLSQLLHKIVPILHLKINQIVYWTDSTIVLAWLAADSSRWNTFVANRVSEVQKLTTSGEWKHVRTQCNPADLISRGLTPQELIVSTLWFHGPEFLHNTQFHNLSDSSIIADPIEIPEQRKTKVMTVSSRKQSQLDICYKYSVFDKLRRVIAYMLRFVNNSRKHNLKCTSPYLTGNELQNATLVILKFVQAEAFSDELTTLTSGKNLKNSNFYSLNPFIDSAGLIRVGGRLRHGTFPYNQKFPIVLPHKHHITKLLIREEHRKQMHAGPQATLASLRLRYWPISGRNAVRRVLRECMTCFKANPPIHHQLMGDLPKHRIEPARPFLHCGVDYAGPVLIRQGTGRGRIKTSKAYIAIFVCFATKAIHIELVNNLTSDAFLNALKRFISRRGRVAHLYSDNGTTFVGARRQLDEFYAMLHSQDFEKQVIEKLQTEYLTWHFIPPRAPHFGGLWEAGVKIIKQHLKKVLGEALVTFEELYTLLTQIESCVNSRPLFPLSNDPNDLSVLTPSHFLIGDSLSSPVEPNLQHVPINRLSRWQHMQKLFQHFWKRWSVEYINILQPRSKWQRSQPQMTLNTMVLVREDNLPPLQWRLGRVIELHPGKDNIVRTVTVQTNMGVVKRAVTKLCQLPINDDQLLPPSKPDSV